MNFIADGLMFLGIWKPAAMLMYLDYLGRAMGHDVCKLPGNTRGAFVAIHDRLGAFATVCLPTRSHRFTVANLVVEGTRFGDGVAIFSFLHAPERRIEGRSKISYPCDSLRSLGRPEF